VRGGERREGREVERRRFKDLKRWDI